MIACKLYSAGSEGHMAHKPAMAPLQFQFYSESCCCRLSGPSKNMRSPCSSTQSCAMSGKLQSSARAASRHRAPHGAARGQSLLHQGGYVYTASGTSSFAAALARGFPPCLRSLTLMVTWDTPFKIVYGLHASITDLERTSTPPALISHHILCTLFPMHQPNADPMSPRAKLPT